ncbi:MAG: polysaccharide pyruvyl transferase family protein [Vicinamibacterales bacterium]
MLVGVVGYYGYGNLGDEWFLRTWREVLGDHAEVQALHPTDDVSLYDALVIGGGDLLTGAVNNHYWRPEMLTRPLWIYGVGAAHSLAREAETYRRFCTAARSVTVRDERSRAALEAIGVQGVRVRPDIAWAGRLPSCQSRLRYDLGISVRPARHYDRDATVQFLRERALEGMSVLAIPLQAVAPAVTNDHDLHVELRDAVRSSLPDRPLSVRRAFRRWRGEYSDAICDVVAPDADLEHRLAAIRACDAYLTMRFHGWIAGLRQAVRSVAWCLPASVKFRALAEALETPTVRVHDLSEAQTALRAPSPPIQDLENRSRESLRELRDEILGSVLKPRR